MSRLSDLYKAMETLRKEGLSLNEDLEKQVSELEEDIIKKEILPVVTQTIEPALKAGTKGTRIGGRLSPRRTY